MRRTILTALLEICIAACGGDSTSAPPPPNPSGGWTSVNGTYAPPSLSLSMSSPGFQTLNFSGTVAQARMTGSLNGSGFSNTIWIFDRQ